MVQFRPMSLLERLKRLSPKYRARKDGEMRAAIRFLVEHPSEPCVVGDTFIPDGFGPTRSTDRSPNDLS